MTQATGGLDPRDPQSIEKVREIIDRIKPDWQGQLIEAILPVIKVVKGVAQPQILAIGFCVRQKLAATALQERGIRPIPAMIEGIPTDVVVTHGRSSGSIDERHTRSQMFDTLVGGIAIGNAEIGAYGTLGMVCFAQGDGRPLGLTNEHVLVDFVSGKPGDEVQQPRYYLHKEASIEPADCCPNGQIKFRQPENVIADVALGAFAVLAIAAALSDEIDPHRRGQKATPVAAGERTKRETVSVELKYPTIPFPGQPYKVGVKWDYTRETDGRTLSARADESGPNPHVLTEQALVTDHDRYVRGATVKFLAMLGPEIAGRSCENYFVVAACQSPSGQRRHRTVLRLLPGGREKPRTVWRCMSFVGARLGAPSTQRCVVNGLVLESRRPALLFQQLDSAHPPVLRFPKEGVSVRLRRPAQGVRVDLVLHAHEPVTLIAFNGSQEVGRTSSTPGAPSAQLLVAAAQITQVRLEGGANEAMLSRVCAERTVGRCCLYGGELQLAPDEELGAWRTYLVAQTRNDVPVGTDPLVAAQTIGGLTVTDNFMSVGESYNITYGKSCLIDSVPDGQFVVEQAHPAVIK